MFFRCSCSPYSDVEDVAAHRAGHGHVSQTFPGHDHAGDQVGDGRPRREDGQAHDFLWDAHSLTHLEKKKDEDRRQFHWGRVTETSVPLLAQHVSFEVFIFC